MKIKVENMIDRKSIVELATLASLNLHEKSERYSKIVLRDIYM